jgi:predicted MFS family arabinose efflux permease
MGRWWPLPANPFHEPVRPAMNRAAGTPPDGTRAPANGPAVGRWPALAPFHTRSFRYQWPADLGTAWALEMETLILGWYVLVESGSVVLLTLFGALMYVGTLLSPVLGMLGDRVGLRRVLAAMRLSYALLAGVTLVLAATGRLQPLLVLGLAFLVGLIKPSDIGLRTALVGASVPSSQLMAAMGISRTTQDSARIGGALAGAGFMASLGMVSAYVAITALYLAGAVLTMRSGGGRGNAAAGPAAAPAPVAAARPTSAWRDVQEGLQHVWRTPRLRAAMTLAALVNLCAFPISGGLMPYIARDVFQLDQRGLGWLVASFAGGALMGSLSLSAFGAHLRPARTMLATCVLWYLCLLGLALPVGVPVAMALFMGAGLNQSLSMVSLSLILLRTSDERYRGRVMGARMLAIYTLPLGLLAAGALIPLIGFRALVGWYGGLGLLMTGLLAWVWRHELLPRAALANTR